MKAGPGRQAAAADELEPRRAAHDPSQTHPRETPGPLNLSAPPRPEPVHSFGNWTRHLWFCQAQHWALGTRSSGESCLRGAPSPGWLQTHNYSIQEATNQGWGDCANTEAGTSPSEAHQPPREQTLWPLILCGPPLCSCWMNS